MNEVTRVDLEKADLDDLRRGDAVEITVTIRHLDKAGAYACTQRVSREYAVDAQLATPALEDVAVRAVRAIAEQALAPARAERQFGGRAAPRFTADDLGRMLDQAGDEEYARLTPHERRVADAEVAGLMRGHEQAAEEARAGDLGPGVADRAAWRPQSRDEAREVLAAASEYDAATRVRRRRRHEEYLASRDEAGGGEPDDLGGSRS